MLTGVESIYGLDMLPDHIKADYSLVDCMAFVSIPHLLSWEPHIRTGYVDLRLQSVIANMNRKHGLAVW